MGGTVGLSPRGADSLGLNSGGFGKPLYLGEADLQYSKKGIAIKALGSYIWYPDGLEEAILWHDGEAKNAKQKFMQLSKTDRDKLISFLQSL